MNYVTREIMARFDVDAEDALKIQSVMDEMDLDFSECTEKEYHTAMSLAHNQWMAEI